MDIAGAGRQVDDQDVERIVLAAPPDLVDHLAHRGGHHGAAPDHRPALLDDEADRHDAKTERLQRDQLAVLEDRLGVEAQHARRGRPIDIGVEQAHAQSKSRESAGEVHRDGGLADAALAAGDRDDAAHVGELLRRRHGRRDWRARVRAPTPAPARLRRRHGHGRGARSGVAVVRATWTLSRRPGAPRSTRVRRRRAPARTRATSARGASTMQLARPPSTVKSLDDAGGDQALGPTSGSEHLLEQGGGVLGQWRTGMVGIVLCCFAARGRLISGPWGGFTTSNAARSDPGRP